MPEESVTEQRKAEHVDIILKENVEAEHNFWNDVHLIHESLPEVDYEEIDVSTKLFGRKLNAPIVIASMTGGFEAAKEINVNLAKAAAEVGIALGVGSQRAALEHPELEDTYAVVKDYDVPLRFANIGAPQLVEQEGKGSFGFEEAQLAMRMVGAHVLLVHMNFLQEAVQPEGDKRAKGCLSAIQRLALRLPVVAKETDGGGAQDSRGDRHRRRRSRRDELLGGRILSRKEGRPGDEGAPRSGLLELGDPDAGIGRDGEDRLACDRDWRRQVRARRRAGNLSRSLGGGSREADAGSGEAVSGCGGEGASADD
jgi:hypothetical protein